MITPNILLVISAILIALYTGFKLGMKFPARHYREKHYEDILVARNTDRIWKCIEVLTDARSGPFGSSLRIILLQSGMKRISLICFDETILPDTSVKLRKREPGEEAGAYLDTLNRLMIPYIVH